MFDKRRNIRDLSLELRDPDLWSVGTLRSLDYPLNITTLSFEPVSGLLAVGTRNGIIYVFGASGVEIKLSLPKPVGIKFLQFATSSFQLVCLDDTSVLHLWSLETYGYPKHLASVRFDLTNSLTVSPSHNHALLSLDAGEIRSYDLLCCRKSPYVIPNLWKLHENTSGNKPPGDFLPESYVIFHPTSC